MTAMATVAVGLLEPEPQAIRMDSDRRTVGDMKAVKRRDRLFKGGLQALRRRRSAVEGPVITGRLGGLRRELEARRMWLKGGATSVENGISCR
jgi:hypothetical protein